MNHRPCCIIRSGGCDGKGFPCVGPDCWFWFCISCVGGTGAADDGSCCWDGMEADDDVGPSPCFEQKSPYMLILEVSHVSLILASAMKKNHWQSHISIITCYHMTHMALLLSQYVDILLGGVYVIPGQLLNSWVQTSFL